MRSILRWLTDRPASPGDTPRSIVLLFANRFEDSVPFREELEQLEARLPGLRVVHVISQPKEDWRGYRDHIDRVVLGHELPQQPSWTYYGSGPPHVRPLHAGTAHRLGRRARVDQGRELRGLRIDQGAAVQRMRGFLDCNRHRRCDATVE